MAFESYDYRLDFNGQANEAPWVEAGWTNYENSFAINTNGLRPNGFVSASAYYGTEFVDTYKVGMTVVTNPSAASDPVGVGLFVSSGANAGKGYFFWHNGTQGSIRRRDAATGIGSNIGSPTTFTITSPVTTDLWDITYNKATGDIDVLRNGASVKTVNDTTYQAEDFYGGVIGSAANNNGRRIGEIGIDGISSGPTVDDSPDDIRVTEPRTFRVTTTATSLNTGNVSGYVNADTNDPISPSSVTNVSGLTYDVVITVPDEYAGLPYDETGYAIIVSTADGDATSAAVPYLPVTGNGDVILTDVSDTDIESSPALEVDDQVEWTNSAVITIDSEGKVSSTEESATFEFRVWDHNDSTWGDWAEVVFGESGGSTGVLTASSLTTSGLTLAGLTRSGLSS